MPIFGTIRSVIESAAAERPLGRNLLEVRERLHCGNQKRRHQEGDDRFVICVYGGNGLRRGKNYGGHCGGEDEGEQLG